MPVAGLQRPSSPVLRGLLMMRLGTDQCHVQGCFWLCLPSQPKSITHTHTYRLAAQLPTPAHGPEHVHTPGQGSKRRSGPTDHLLCMQTRQPEACMEDAP